MNRTVCAGIAFLAAAAMAAAATAAAPDTRKILKDIDDLGNFAGKDFSCVYTIVAAKKGEEPSVTQARIFRRDERDQFVMLFLQPEAQRGQGYLQVDDNVWFYDPESGKFEKSSLKENVAGSDAQNADLTREKLSEDYTVARWQADTLGKDKIPVWVLYLEANKDSATYDKLTLWVRQDANVILKEEDYSVSGRLMRTVAYTKYIEVDRKYIPSQILFIDELNEGEKTQVSLKDASTARLPDSTFSKAFIQRASK